MAAITYRQGHYKLLAAVPLLIIGWPLQYLQTPNSEPKLTNPDEVREAFRGLKVGNAPGPIGIPNRALKHLLMRAVHLLVQIFNAILRTHHFPPVWKHARVFSILKEGSGTAIILSAH